jgi:hypothetical protein
MEAAEGIAQLLDFGFGDVFLVLGASQLLRHIFQIAQHAFEDIADQFHFSPGLVD